MMRRLIAAVLIFLSMAAVPAQATPSPSVKARSEFWTLLGKARASHHVAPLQWNGRLSERSAAWSKTMSQTGFRHSNIGELLGPYNFVGENIGTGTNTTPAALHKAFMNSPEHRDNILNPGFTSAGVGVYINGHSLWVTVEFARRS